MSSPQSTPHHTSPHKRHRLRTHRRFRLSFINENTFNEVWTIGMSQRKVIAAIVLIFIAIGCMAATLIVLTPLRTLLPGYLQQNERQENAINVLRVDSVLSAAHTTSAYLDNVAAILRGDTTVTGPNATQLQEHSINPDSLLEATERENTLVRQVEERHRYSISGNPSQAKPSYIFHAPVAGAELLPASTPLSVCLRVPDNSSVSAPAPSTIIEAGYSPADLWKVILQHPNGYVTYISGISRLSAGKGQRLVSGEAIGTAGQSSPVTIELWNAGSQLEPLRFMPL